MNDCVNADIRDRLPDLLHDRLDLESRAVRTWSADGCYPGEPVFVSASRDGPEDEGVILCVVLNPVRNNSFLLVLELLGRFRLRARGRRTRTRAEAC